MKTAITIVPECKGRSQNAPTNQDYVEVSYNASADRFVVISKTTAETVEILLQGALNQVREMKSEIKQAEAELGFCSTITVTRDSNMEAA